MGFLWGRTQELFNGSAHDILHLDDHLFPAFILFHWRSMTFPIKSHLLMTRPVLL